MATWLLRFVTLTKISRERNAEPDALTRLAYQEAKEEHPEWPIGTGAKAKAKATTVGRGP